MKVLVNATTCVVGGGVYVAASLIRQMARYRGAETWFVAVSPQVRDHCGDIPASDRFKLVVVCPSPAKPIRGRRSARLLLEIESAFTPDVVFTVFGPAYVRFRRPHLCGFANAWVTHPSRIAYSTLCWSKRIRSRLLRYLRLQLLRSVDAFVVQTPTVRKALSELLKLPLNRISVIPNACSDLFHNVPDGFLRRPGTLKSGPVQVLTLAAPYPHKKLTIIPDVASILRRIDISRVYHFTVTLPQECGESRRLHAKAEDLGVAHMITNVGQVPLKDCPGLYAKSDMLFHPTLLESFSATYLEAMKMRRPIVTTDLGFAHDVCGDAALYYSPLSAADAANAIKHVANDGGLAERLIDAGTARLRRFPTATEQFDMYVEVVHRFSQDPGAIGARKLRHA